MEDKNNGCGGCADAACEAEKRKNTEAMEKQKLSSRLSKIKRKIVVMSGKGGVGKSTVAVNLAVSLALKGKRVGLLDVDIHGPSIPTMLGIKGRQMTGSEDGINPVEVEGLKVMSIGLLASNDEEAIIWRGPVKGAVIKQFIQDVAWGDLDYLIVDAPPGTGDEPLSLCQIIGTLDGAVIVTTPQKVASVDVKKSITFCRRLNVPILGVVENMSGFVCPHCGQRTDIFPAGGGAQLAREMGVKFLGAIPLDAQVADSGDSGLAFIHHYAESSTAKAMAEVIKPILDL
ncbi:MAG: Mrp/NBP35 family ATP-binding protein [Deltaproteobacteria bacterium]|nr:Mrp/NBP35 family ATP-binding protein [Deltaproteobacteria bacterium]